MFGPPSAGDHRGTLGGGGGGPAKPPLPRPLQTPRPPPPPSKTSLVVRNLGGVGATWREHVQRTAGVDGVWGLGLDVRWGYGGRQGPSAVFTLWETATENGAEMM